MKLLHIFSILIATLTGCGVAHTQTAADVKMGEILNGGDLFELREQYPILQDSISIEMLRLVAESQLGIGFNRIERAGEALDSLLQNHQDELGAESSIGMAALRAMNLLNSGRYEEGGKAGEELVKALKDSVPYKALYSLIFIERIGKALANTPAPYIDRPQRDVSVPMRCDTVGRGKHIYIPVEVNGITKEYIFDTGCSFGNFVSEKYAEEAGLRVVADSIPVSGMNIGFVKLAVADSLKVGEIVYHNPVFMVAPTDHIVDSVFAFDGVLGYHFIRDIKETIIDNQTQRFVFPYRISKGEPNMYLASNTPNLQIEYAGKQFDVIFDTGNVKSLLDEKFAQMYPEAVSGLTEHATHLGGFGGISRIDVVTLPEFCFSVSGTAVKLGDVEVIKLKPDSSPTLLYSSSLGADFVLSFKRLTINYESMFVKGEQY